MATNNRKPVETTAEESKVVETKATENESKAAEKPKNAPVKTKAKPKPQESTYPVEELAKAHKTFDASYAIASAALKLSGKERATFKEAKEIIETFKNKEVK